MRGRCPSCVADVLAENVAPLRPARASPFADVDACDLSCASGAGIGRGPAGGGGEFGVRCRARVLSAAVSVVVRVVTCGERFVVFSMARLVGNGFERERAA